MKKMGKCIQLFACLAIIGFGPWIKADLFAQKVLSGAELENGCQVYADKAVKMAKEWEQRQCGKKLDLYPQIMDTERDWQYKRCIRGIGTTLGPDLKSLEDYLKQCPGGSNQPTDYEGNQQGWQQGGQTGQQGDPQRRPDPMTGTNSRRDNPTDMRSSGGEIWDILVINSADLARSNHSYRIPSLNGIFAAQNMIRNGPDFRGQMNGSVFEAVMTDNTGYRATFIGHGAGWGVIEGTGCDNRNRSYSFTMKRR
jgi:hypothetical protein